MLAGRALDLNGSSEPLGVDRHPNFSYSDPRHPHLLLVEDAGPETFVVWALRHCATTGFVVQGHSMWGWPVSTFSWVRHATSRGATSSGTLANSVRVSRLANVMASEPGTEGVIRHVDAAA